MKDNALLIYQKGHDAGLVVFGRPCDQGKTANHVSIDDVIVGRAGGVLTLAFEDFEIIAVKVLAGLAGVL